MKKGAVALACVVAAAIVVWLTFFRATEEEKVRQTLGRLVKAVMEHQEGSLRDDATVMTVEWLGPPG